MWVLTILAIIGGQVYITRTVIRARFKLESLEKNVAKVKMDEKVARGNLEITKRALAEIRGRIRIQVEAIEKVNQVIQTFEGEKKKKLEETKKKLLR